MNRPPTTSAHPSSDLILHPTHTDRLQVLYKVCGNVRSKARTAVAKQRRAKQRQLIRYIYTRYCSKRMQCLLEVLTKVRTPYVYTYTAASCTSDFRFPDSFWSCVFAGLVVQQYPLQNPRIDATGKIDTATEINFVSRSYYWFVFIRQKSEESAAAWVYILTAFQAAWCVIEMWYTLCGCRDCCCQVRKSKVWQINRGIVPWANQLPAGSLDKVRNLHRRPYVRFPIFPIFVCIHSRI